MNVVVLLKIYRLAETLVAVVALEGQIGLVRVPQHVYAKRSQHRGLVIALLAHVARIEMCLLVPGQVAEQTELLRTVFARKVTNGVSHQVFLIIAFVSKHLVAGLADELRFRFLFLHLQIGRMIDRIVTALSATLATGVLLHVLPQVHVRSEHASALGTRVLTFTLVLEIVIVQKCLRREEYAA